MEPQSIKGEQPQLIDTENSTGNNDFVENDQESLIEPAENYPKVVRMPC